MVTREVKWDKRRNKLLLQIWLLCLSSVFGGNILDTQPLAFSGICTQLPYGHELRIILNLNRNIKTRQGFWSEASFPEEKYYRYPYVHVLRGAKKENAHFSDTALEQNCSCLYKAGAHTGQAQPRHHSTLQHSTAPTWAYPRDPLSNTEEAFRGCSRAKQEQKPPLFSPQKTLF